MNHFMEIAKMRAARVLWAKLVKRSIQESEITGPTRSCADVGLEPVGA